MVMQEEQLQTTANHLGVYFVTDAGIYAVTIASNTDGWLKHG